MDERALERYREPRGMATLAFGVLAGPIAWVVQFGVVYPVAQLLCGASRAWLALPFGATLAALAATALALRAAHRAWVASGRPRHGEVPGDPFLGRTRMLALAGMGASAFFLVVIVVQALPLLLLDPCRR